jgi:hypothetical protein
MRCDGEDFVVALLPENEVIFRTKDARSAESLPPTIDTTRSTDDWTWPPDIDANRRKDA